MPSNLSLTKGFHAILKGIVSGRLGDVPSCSGLDSQTIGVLNLLALQPKPKRPSDIRACHIEFARQLDGTHAREAHQAELHAWQELLGQVRG